MHGNTDSNHLHICDECLSEYFADKSNMKSLCPECAHILYGYENCIHEFKNGRCSKCYWNGNTYNYMQSLKSAGSADTINCLNCNKAIATLEKEIMVPPPEDCYKRGNVPVPNLGWFCSQDCATQFEQDNGVRFTRNEQGLVDYYNI